MDYRPPSRDLGLLGSASYRVLLLRAPIQAPLCLLGRASNRHWACVPTRMGDGAKYSLWEGFRALLIRVGAQTNAVFSHALPQRIHCPTPDRVHCPVHCPCACTPFSVRSASCTAWSAPTAAGRQFPGETSARTVPAASTRRSLATPPAVRSFCFARTWSGICGSTASSHWSSVSTDVGSSC